jgi:hypothetical protein
MGKLMKFGSNDSKLSKFISNHFEYVILIPIMTLLIILMVHSSGEYNKRMATYREHRKELMTQCLEDYKQYVCEQIIYDGNLTIIKK